MTNVLYQPPKRHPVLSTSLDGKLVTPCLERCGCHNGLQHCQGGEGCCGACDDPCIHCKGYGSFVMVICRRCQGEGCENCQENDGVHMFTLDEAPSSYLNFADALQNKRWEELYGPVVPYDPDDPNPF